MIRRVLLLLVATFLAAAAPAAAAEPKTSVIDLEDEVMCVSCNVPLNIAESPQATAQRAEIQRLVDQGLTKDEIKDRLVVEYGRNVLAQPDDSGFGLAAYLVPIAVGGLGIALLVLLIPRWRRRATAGPGLSVPTPVDGGATAGAVSATPSADAERRLDAELARFDR
jgi:cytochrome c-type biogenesis protein CcmH